MGDAKEKIKRFSIEEMGTLFGNPKLCYLHLDQDFIRKHLNEKAIFEEKKETGVDLKVSNVLCPFCYEGLIKIAFSGPIHDPGMTGPHPNRSGHEGRLAGESYQYECTNKECIARFKGEDIWLKA